MLAQHEFYLERAAEARAVASAATLDNVRDRWLRSESSWTEMAARSARNEKMRAKLIAEKATERAALKTASGSGDDA
jgi:excinuclease UvrABC helicase subunit UvrB